ncbi:PAS domain-containing protein, partial [Gloeocapsopsis crepidinum]
MTFFYPRLGHNITLFAIALVVFGKLLLEPTTQLDFGLALFVIVLITSTWQNLILRLAVISLAIGLLLWNEADNAAYWQLGLWGGVALVLSVINNLERQSVEVSATTLGEVTMALETAVECIARLDFQGQYLTANHAYAHLLGYKPEDLIGKNWEITVHPQDVAKLTATYRQMLTTGKAEGEARGIRQDGSHFYKQVTLVKVNNQQNSVSDYYCFVKDITQRKQQEERLRLLESVVVN